MNTGYIVYKTYRAPRYAKPGDPPVGVFLDFSPATGTWHWTACFRCYAAVLTRQGAQAIARAMPALDGEADVRIDVLPMDRAINELADAAALAARKDAA